MTNRTDIVRAWKDQEYRMSLTEAQRAALPENPAGLIELNAAELESAAGGKPAGGPVSVRFSCNPARCRPTVGVKCMTLTPQGCPNTNRTIL